MKRSPRTRRSREETYSEPDSAERSTHRRLLHPARTERPDPRPPIRRTRCSR